MDRYRIDSFVADPDFHFDVGPDTGIHTWILPQILHMLENQENVWLTFTEVPVNIGLS